MRIVIAGAHGKIALILGRMLHDRGEDVVGIIRNPAQADDLRAVGVTPAVLDLEKSDTEAVVRLLAGADAVVFAAGAGPGSGAQRKDTVDRAAAVLLAQAAEKSGVRRYVQISSVGADAVADGARPDGLDDVFYAYLVAKLAAEDDLRGRDLDWTILRPGALIDGPGTGQVKLAPKVNRGSVPRADVAAVVVALLDAPATAGKVLELVSGNSEIAAAVRKA
ncbi:SDR family oxidoreductase [Kineosporia rhizophila]|uniref:NAD(P)-binding oxidoreductase n=1 Tax=Kineosporia TaxID=49184 RepID=UPI001E5BF75B|nr:MULTISPECIES: NAD(P)-binding oxidoreductase [Kineosporia]MCE0535781.1 SDR family oxidoreductase [Kineosporia rhizophila]GLY18235.1 NAD-dependent dehydratase [Kineosporia sp. NBRC 101677]